MIDKDTGRPRGFGFVTFDNEQAVENALNHPDLQIHGKAVCIHPLVSLVTLPNES